MNDVMKGDRIFNLFVITSIYQLQKK